MLMIFFFFNSDQVVASMKIASIDIQKSFWIAKWKIEEKLMFYSRVDLWLNVICNHQFSQKVVGCSTPQEIF